VKALKNHSTSGVPQSPISDREADTSAPLSDRRNPSSLFTLYSSPVHCTKFFNHQSTINNQHTPGTSIRFLRFAPKSLGDRAHRITFFNHQSTINNHRSVTGCGKMYRGAAWGSIETRRQEHPVAAILCCRTLMLFYSPIIMIFGEYNHRNPGLDILHKKAAEIFPMNHLQFRLVGIRKALGKADFFGRAPFKFVGK
jgi:hypothetical protein